jgi:predicted AAA+ superfamily ATPase
MAIIPRSAEKYLDAWYRKTGKKPLVIRGARQVGKSTLVRQFAEDRGLVLNEINLERHLYLYNPRQSGH